MGFGGNGDSEVGEGKGGFVLSHAHFMHDGRFELGNALKSPEVANDAVGKFMVEERRGIEFGEKIPSVRFVRTIGVARNDIGLGS